MSSLDSLFETETKALSHPKIRSWTELLRASSIVPTCEIFRRREGLSFQPAEIYVHFAADRTEKEGWDSTLNSFLLTEKVRAIDAANEELRFALMLRDFLQAPESRFGDGFYNAVLIIVIEEYFGKDARVNAKLVVLRGGNPHKQGTSFQDCLAMIKGALANCAKHLTDDLQYDRPTAENILAGAVDKYLDERFSFTNRKLLGLT